MNSKKYLLFLLLPILILIPFNSMAAGSASINLSPTTGSYNVGQTFNVVISVNPGLEKIDMARVKLSFSPDLLEIKNFSQGTTFSFQAGSNGFDNSAGTFYWGAGAPGGIKAVSNFGTITFLAKKAGKSGIDLSNESLLLSAGENKFNGQPISFSYNLLTQNVTKIANKKPQQDLSESQQSTTVAQPFEDNNNVSTEIVQKKTQSLASDIINHSPFVSIVRLLIILAFIFVAIILGIMLYRIRKKPI